MHEEEIQALFNSPAGYLGPLHVEWAKDEKDASKPLLIVEEALRGRTNLISGANKEEYHVKNITPDVTFRATSWADLRNAVEGEGCPNCGHALKVAKAVEIGHIFKLGYKYSESMGARVLDENGKEVTPIMGSYGIGLERILTSCIEQNNDANGFWLPANIAPFQVVVVPTNTTDETINSAGIAIAHRLEDAGIDVLLDDRDERPGVKFKDADLVGIPYRINVGKKLADGLLEVVTRATSTREDVGAAEVVVHLLKLLSQEGVAASKNASRP
jgi:prolyl-tRNA synthetase